MEGFPILLGGSEAADDRDVGRCPPPGGPAVPQGYEGLVERRDTQLTEEASRGREGDTNLLDDAGLSLVL